jgi:hypothetical protein
MLLLMDYFFLYLPNRKAWHCEAASFREKSTKNRKTKEESFVLNKDNASTYFLLPLLLKLSRMSILYVYI